MKGMATDKDPKLHAQVLCSNCRNPLVTSASKSGGHFGVEVLVDKCGVCKPELAIETVELVLNDSERVTVDVEFLQ